MRLIKQLTAWPFLVIMICSAALTYLIPPEWIRTIPGMNTLLQWMVEHVPALSAYIKKSRFPQVAEIYFPLMLLVSPLHFVWIWRNEEQHAIWRNLFSEKPFRTFIRLLLTTALLVFGGFFTFLWGGTQLESVPWNDSKIALCLAGHIAAGGGFFTLLGNTLSGYKKLIKK